MKRCTYYCDNLKTCRALLNALYEIDSVGGCLHIVVDDENIRDSDIKYCIEYAKQNEDRLDSAISITLGEEMLKLTMPQRRLLLLPGMCEADWICPFSNLIDRPDCKCCDVSYAFYKDDENC